MARVRFGALEQTFSGCVAAALDERAYLALESGKKKSVALARKLLDDAIAPKLGRFETTLARFA